MPGKYHRPTANENRRYRRSWKRLTAALSLLVVLATVSSLTLPAITMNQDNCEVAEHQHTELCYSQGAASLTCAEQLAQNACTQTTHQHTQDCYEIEPGTVRSCTYETLGVHKHEKACYDQANVLTCELADFVVHTHDGNCYDETTTLVCLLPEVKEHTHTAPCWKTAEADPGHAHGDACYAWTRGEALLCQLPESEEHTHEAACYEQVKGDLVCTEQERPAAEAETVLACALIEAVLHTHEDDCFLAASEIQESTEAWILELVAQQKEAGVEDNFLICTEREVLQHQHTQDCYYEGTPKLICETAEHVHTAACTSVTVSHVHDEYCYDESGVLVCALPELNEHVHTENCYIDEAEITQNLEAWILDLIAQQRQSGVKDSYLICSKLELPVHQHTEACFTAGEPTLTCQIPEHTHNTECTEPAVPELTEEEKLAVSDLMVLIEGLPTLEEFEGKYAASSTIHKPEYVANLSAQIAEINTRYNGLTQAQQEQVLNFSRVADLTQRLSGLAQTEGTLEFAGDEYTIAVTATSDANLPVGTVITADPLYDSNEAAPISLFSLFSQEESQEDSGAAYAEQVMAAITWGEVTRIKLFDITLRSGSQEVQPAAPVTVRTQFAEPVVLEDNELIYGVHIGENGVELLPATTERDDNGNITAISHVQSSFSPTGYVYVLTHSVNPDDEGPDVLPVHYCIWINDQWVIAGSTRYGWYGNYTDVTDWTNETRDCITLDQIGSVLTQYGLDITDHDEVWRTLWYQRNENVTNPNTQQSSRTVRHDTRPMEKELTYPDGTTQTKVVFPLSGNLLKDDGYFIYYVPEGTTTAAENSTSGTYANESALAADLKIESKFFTLTVRDRAGTVYQNQADVPATQVAKYGTAVSVKLKNNPGEDGTDRGWQWVNDKGAVVNGLNPVLNGVVDTRFGHQDNGDGTATYSFSGILGRTTLIPYDDSMSNAQMDPNRKVDIAVHLDGKWQKVGTVELMYRQNGVCLDDSGKEMWFVTAGQVYAVLENFGFNPGTYRPDDDQNIGHVFTHAIGSFDENGMTMHADGVNNVIDTTVAIGLGHADAASTNFTLFYVPGSSSEPIEAVANVNSNDYAKSSYIEGDRFYTISVKDEYQLVYYGYETENFKAYIPEGQAASVSVEGKENVLWTLRQNPDYAGTSYTVVPSGIYNDFQFEAVNGPLSIEASSLDPQYTVQYYSLIERYQLFGSTADLQKELGTDAKYVDLINTAGGNLPQNSTTQSLVYLGLTDTGRQTDQNAPGAAATDVWQVSTYEDNTEVYSPNVFKYSKANSWLNVDKLNSNDGYVIDSIWILKEGMSPVSTNENDWWIYETNDGQNISFTNKASDEYAPRVEDQNGNTVRQPDTQNYTILITEGMVLRLYYTIVDNAPADYNAKFHDYDISAAGNGVDVRQQGINAIHNGKTNTAGLYAFGNTNSYTGMGTAKWNGNYLNKYNSSAYAGCTFGMVKSITADGKINWSSGITGPNLYASGSVSGRTDYQGKLYFSKRGEVYTLTSTTVSGTTTRTGLEYFFNPAYPPDYEYTNGRTHTSILTNNFWVLDNVENDDPHMGRMSTTTTTTRGTITAGYKNSSADNTRGAAESSGKSFAPSDDGRAHNWFFGMSAIVDFFVPEDYTGPLEYIFFGDDDMWIMLDSDKDGDGVFETQEMICDIGGVHSAVGEYVNLRDYLPVGGDHTAGNHQLRFYYTERGASGSTCWMSFTLPFATSHTEANETASISITKDLANTDGTPMDSAEKFDFSLRIYEDNTKTTLLNETYRLVIKRADGTIYNGSITPFMTFPVGKGDVVTIDNVPIGKWYEVVESPDNRFEVTVVNGEGEVQASRTAEGWIVPGANAAAFTNTLISYQLPHTGGVGPAAHIFCGLCLMATAAWIYLSQREKEKGVPI